MSAFGLYPVFNPPVPEACCASGGEELAKSFNALDDLAEDNDLAPLTAFADNREIFEDFDETSENLDGLTEPWEEWFECEEGIEVFGGIARLIREQPKAVSHLPNAASLAQELDALAQALKIAQGKGSRFRLELRESMRDAQ